MKMGGKCIDCHTNHTGGLLRNQSGWSYGKNNLKMWNSQTEGEEFELSPMIGKNITYGFDFRTQFLTRFDSANTRSDFHRMTGSVYINTAVSDKIDLFSRYDFVQGVWEAYGTLQILPNGYIKTGTFTPNYGIRLDDHSAYTRNGDYSVITFSNNGLIYDPRYTESGVEVGMYFSDLAFLTFSAGGSGFPSFKYDPAYTANLLITPQISDDFNVMGGVSYAKMKRFGFGGSVVSTSLFGVYGGFGFGPFTLLGEFDQAKSLYQDDSTMTAVMIEAAYKITTGLDAVIRFDSFSGDDPLTTNGKEMKLKHIILGAEWFPYCFVEIKPQYRINTEDPDAKNNAFVLQFHFWY
jgi:hypothetical protein